MILIVLLIAAAAVLIWERLMRRALAEAVEVTLDADASEINAGEELGFTETVVNRGVMPVPVMEIRFRIGKGLRFMNAENITESDYLYKRDVFSLLSHEQITREYRVLGEKRGFYQVSGADISMRAVPSFNEYVRALDADLSFYVYALRVPVRDILAAIETPLGQLAAANRLYEDPFSFAQIREYQQTDPMKTINWKANAKTGQLMVNTYTSVRSEQIAVYLDLEERRIVKTPDRTEECISVAASLMETLLTKNLESALVIGIRDSAHGDHPQPYVFGPGRGSTLLKELEQFLTGDFAEAETVPMDAMLSHFPPGGRVPVIITKNADSEMMRSIEAALPGGQSAIVVAVSGDGEMLPAAGGQIRLMRRKVTV